MLLEEREELEESRRRVTDRLEGLEHISLGRFHLVDGGKAGGFRQ